MNDADTARRIFAQAFATPALKASFSESESRLIVEQITGKSPMKAPTEQQLNDSDWWDANCEPWVQLIAIETDARGGLERIQQRADARGSVFDVSHPDNDLTLYERPTKPAAPDWDGGMPKAGVHCEVWVYESSSWQSCLTLDATTGSGEIACTTIAPDGHFRQLLWGVKFRPIRTQAEQEVEDLQEDLLGILPFCEYTDDQISEMAKILHTQGYRKPDAGMLRKGASDER